MTKRQQSTRRVYFLIAVMSVWAAVIGVRLCLLQVVESASLKLKADKQQQRTVEISPQRGIIYDRNGNELAISIKVDSVFAVPEEIENPIPTAKILSELTGVSAAELVERLDSDKSFVWIKRKISAAESAAIQKARLPGIYFQKEDRRFYPKGELAAHVLGYVNKDDQGMGGLEYRYNDSIRGTAGKLVVTTDGRRRRFDSMEQAPAPGANLVTTIDENLQYIVEKEMKEAQEETQASGISVVMMNPHNGEILAMANYPQFNPNEYGKYPPSSWINRAVSHTYEPGSTFKIVTVGSALEEKLTRPEEVIDCQMGSIVLYGHRIHDHERFGLLTVQGIMQHSSDVGAIKLGLRLGEDRFASYIKRMGFGRQTGVDLPGEERGLAKPADRWSKISIGAISMGQEIGVTPLQIVTMVSAVANGGTLYRPYVVKEIQQPEKSAIETRPHGERVWSAKTASELQEMLEIVVTDGTAKASRLDGYTAAGKTGTAQKIDETGHYSKTRFVASFAGFAPATNPEIAMIVVVDEPRKGSHMGGAVAGPVFKRIAEQALRTMSVPPDVPLYAPQFKQQIAKKKSEPEHKPSMPAPLFPSDSRAAASEWKVVDASYTTAASAPAGFAGGEVAIPDFYGRSLRDVTEQCLKLGIRLRSAGSGAAVQQLPAAGTSVRVGGVVQVTFATKKQ